MNEGGKLTEFLARIMPRSLVRAAAIRLMTENYSGNPAARSCVNALNAWDGIKRRKRGTVRARMED